MGPILISLSNFVTRNKGASINITLVAFVFLEDFVHNTISSSEVTCCDFFKYISLEFEGESGVNFFSKSTCQHLNRDLKHF